MLKVLSVGVLEHFSGEDYRPQGQDRGVWGRCGVVCQAGGLLLVEALRVTGQDAQGADGALIPVDLDATIVIAHSDKEQEYQLR